MIIDRMKVICKGKRFPLAKDDITTNYNLSFVLNPQDMYVLLPFHLPCPLSSCTY
jgi:hypothetical protein